MVGGDQTPYINELTEYIHEIYLPGDGCYEFNIYDSFDDGMCCEHGNGSFVLTNDSGEVLFEGGEFESNALHAFAIEGNTTPIMNNGQIADFNSSNTYFCFNHDVSPQVVFQNLGQNDITSAGFEIYSSTTGVLSTFEWTGLVETNEYAIIDLEGFAVDENTTVTTSITHVCLLYTSPSPRDATLSRMPSSA